MDFEPGKIYSRQDDIHARFRGQRRGGISTPVDAPYVFVFTGETGEQYGYRDGWDKEGVFHYTGEGQVGDMRFDRGNRAIRDHGGDGKDLLVFEARGKGKGYRFIGTFACANYELRRGPDKNGNDREIIVFHLTPVETLGESLDGASGTISNEGDLGELREAAYRAGGAPGGAGGKDAKRTVYERSKDVRDYVLARANGICECCGLPAPFKRRDGSPYLEPHHTRRLSDGGPDHPEHVGAVCPNCHREIHHGASGALLNEKLKSHIRVRETA